MRYIGLDLGTKTLGIAISDKTRTLVKPLKVVRFKSNDYEVAVKEVMALLKEYDIAKIILGLPKNMDNTLGFASKRSLDFKKMLEEQTEVPIILEDERLTTVEAENYLLDADVSREKRKKVIDKMAAMLILDTYLKREKKDE